jgi:hypothetical protein
LYVLYMIDKYKAFSPNEEQNGLFSYII